MVRAVADQTSITICVTIQGGGRERCRKKIESYPQNAVAPKGLCGKGVLNPAAPHGLHLLAAGMGDLNAVDVAGRVHEGFL